MYFLSLHRGYRMVEEEMHFQSWKATGLLICFIFFVPFVNIVRLWMQLYFVKITMEKYFNVDESFL